MAIVGGGAAGLAAAIFARRDQPVRSVLILEGARTPGAKILVSGGSRCNVTNVRVTDADFWGGPRSVVRRVLRALSVPDTIQFFRDIGVPLHEEEDGKLFPDSNRARDVLDGLLREAARVGAILHSHTRVIAIDVTPEGFRLSTSRGTVVARTVVLATGGRSLPKSGSDGQGYEFARALGHTIVPTTPALVPLVIGGRLLPLAPAPSSPRSLDPDELRRTPRLESARSRLRAAAGASGITPLAPGPHPRRELTLTPRLGSTGPRLGVAAGALDLSGVSHDAELTVWIDGAVAARLRGALLWTHFGISGPVALDASRHWARADLEGRDVAVTLNVCPGESFDAVDERLKRLAIERPRALVSTGVATLLPAALAVAIVGELAIAPDTTLAHMTRDVRRRLAHLLTAWPLAVTGTRGYTVAEATAGGVALDEIDPATMESRTCPGVYLIGEILDVDGRIGGFNFQWAWSSARAAARGLSRRSPATTSHS